MNIETKLGLAFLAIFLVGLSAMCWGFGRFQTGFAIFGGVAICALGLVGFSAIWRNR